MNPYYEDDDGVGYRFKPTDEELVGYFLYKKVVARQPLPPIFDHIVLHFDKPVSDIIPWNVWDQFRGRPFLLDDGCLYFFAHLETTTSTRKGKGKEKEKGKGKEKGKDSSRFIRKIESTGGTWSESRSTKVTDRNGNHIGKRRYIRYENSGKEHDGDWLLDEYSLVNVASKTVLCRLRKKPSTNNSRQEFEKPAERANKRAREDSGSSSSVRPQIPSVISGDYEEPPLPPPPQSYSTTLTSVMVHDQALMVSMSNTDQTERVHDQALMMSNSDVYEQAGEGDHGTNIEEYSINIDDLLAPILEELPTDYELGAENSIISLEDIDQLLPTIEEPSFEFEKQQLPFPTDDYEHGPHQNSIISFQDMFNQPIDDDHSAFWWSCLNMSEGTSCAHDQFYF